MPVRLCRGGPRSGKSTAGSGRTQGKQTGPPELPRINSRSAGSSRDGVAGTAVRLNAHSSRQFMCQSSRGPVQSPEAACPLHVASQPVLETSVSLKIVRLKWMQL